jgi:hypothetical protein
LLNDKMPTGLLVSPGMNHGGPFPAPPANGAGQAGHPGFTAVGIPASLLRFAALHGYDNVREPRLPPELRDKNPTSTPCGGGLMVSGPAATWRYPDDRLLPHTHTPRVTHPHPRSALARGSRPSEKDDTCICAAPSPT